MWRPEGILDGQFLTVNGQVIEAVDASPSTPLSHDLSAGRWLALPGLINAYDRLNLAISPRITLKSPCTSLTQWWQAWDADPLADEWRSLPRPLIQRLALWKNWLAGTTTILSPDQLEDNVQAPQNSVLALSETSGHASFHSVAFGDGLPAAVPPKLTEFSAGSVSARGGSVVSEQDAALLRRLDVPMTLLPAASWRRFGMFPQINLLASRGIRLMIGTDTVLAGQASVAAEWAFLLESSQDWHGPHSSKVNWLTSLTEESGVWLNTAPPRGRLEASYRADVVIVRREDNHAKLAESLAGGNAAMVMIGGVPMLGNLAFENFALQRPFRHRLNGEWRWLSQPLADWMEDLRLATGYDKPLPFLLGVDG